MKHYKITFRRFKKECRNLGKHNEHCYYDCVIKGMAGVKDCLEEDCPVLGKCKEVRK